MLGSLVMSLEDLLSPRSVAMSEGDVPLIGGVIVRLLDLLGFADDVREQCSLPVVSEASPLAPVEISSSVSHFFIIFRESNAVRGKISFEPSDYGALMRHLLHQPASSPCHD